MNNLERDINNLIYNSTLPILACGISSDNFSDKVVIESRIDRKDLSVIGSHPAWLIQLELIAKKNDVAMLIIDNLDLISEHDQSKFLELLKYKSISGFKLPDNTHIVIVCSDLNKVSQDIKSYCVIVKAGGQWH